MTENNLYSTRDVQEWFQCSHTTAYRLMRDAGIEVVRLGNRYRIPESEFLRLIEERTEKLGDIEQTHDEA